MKKYVNLAAILLMVSGMLFFASCEDNDDDNPGSDSPMVGTWQHDTTAIEILIDGQDILDYLIETLELSEALAEEMKNGYYETMNEFEGTSWTFASDFTFKFVSPEGNETGTWSLSSDQKTLTLSSDGETDTIQVKSLTASKMELFIAEEVEEDMNGDEEWELLSIDLTLTLQK